MVFGFNLFKKEKPENTVTDDEAKEIEKGKSDIDELEKTADKIMGGGDKANSEVQETDKDLRTDFSKTKEETAEEDNKKEEE
jgi:hypothetical protein